MPSLSRHSPLSAHIKGRDTFSRDMNELVDGLKTVHHVYSPEITILGPTTATGIWAMTDWVQMPEGLFRGWAGATTTRSTRRSTTSGRSERPTALGIAPSRAGPSHRIIPLT